MADFCPTCRSVSVCRFEKEDGSWGGIIGELTKDDEADFTVVVTMLYNRIKVIRFTRIYAIDTFVFVTNLAQPIPQWLSIFRPFRSESPGALRGIYLHTY